MRVLLVEDSESLQRTLGAGLRHSGFTLEQASDGYRARTLLERGDYDAVVLDLMIPGIDGLTLLSWLRRRDDRTRVLILSAKDRVEDRVAGLDLGADDYLVKPFAFDELVSRLRALGRRERRDSASRSTSTHGALTLDGDARRITWHGETLAVTPSEFRLLELLLRRQDHVFSHDRLIEQVYPIEHEVSRNALEAHVSTLRRKLRAAGIPPLIETRRGFGYVIPSPSATPPSRSPSER